MGFAVISKCSIEFPEGTPNVIFEKVTELLKANDDFYHIQNHPREIYFEISGYKGIDYDGVKEIKNQALEELKNWGHTQEGFVINCAEYTEALDGYYFEFSDVADWFDNYLEESDRELLHRELDLKIAYPAHFDDLITEDQEKVKQAKQKETDKE